ncbi:MAG: hypothetical protein KatS3mg038_1024 [Candidatus Kapaibacterium sp.]|nr:MAG: hypothetical protein KatS3mg038_1024 [Candidatus Kapabacteria bacterium]
MAISNKPKAVFQAPPSWEEHVAIIRDTQCPPDVRDQSWNVVWEAFAPLTRKIVGYYSRVGQAPRGAALIDDIRAELMSALYRAALQYDPSKAGANGFPSYAATAMYRAAARAYSQHVGPFKRKPLGENSAVVPADAVEEGVSGAVLTATLRQLAAFVAEKRGLDAARLNDCLDALLERKRLQPSLESRWARRIVRLAAYLLYDRAFELSLSERKMLEQYQGARCACGA